MAVELIPSVLAQTPRQLRKRILLAEGLSNTIHLDVMDGKLVSTKSVSIATLTKTHWKNKIENPSSEMKKFLDSYRYSSFQDYLGKERVEHNILKVESFPDYFEAADSFQAFVQSYFIEI